MKILSIVLILSLQTSVWASGELTSRSNRQVSEIEKTLERAQNYFNALPKDISGAKHYLGSAQEKLSGFLKQSQQYESHSRIVSLQTQMKLLAQQVESPTTTSAPTKAVVIEKKQKLSSSIVTPAVTKASINPTAASQEKVKPLNGGAKYKLRSIKENFNRIKKLISQNAFSHVKKELAEFDESYKQMLKNYAIPANHPELASFTAELMRVKKEFNERLAKVDALKAELKPFIDSMEETKLKLEGDYKLKQEGALVGIKFFTNKSSLYDLVYSKIDSRDSRDKQSKVISDYLQELYKKNSEINKLLPIARRQTKNFFEQFPTADKIKAILLTDKPFKMATALKKLIEETWPEEKERATKNWLDSLTKEMNKADAKVTKAFSNKNDHVFIEATGKHVDYWILTIYGPLLSAVEIMYPDKTGASENLPLTTSQIKMRQQALKFQEDLRLYRNIIAKLSKDSADELARLAKQRLDNSRFPSGKKLSDAEKTIVTNLLEPILETKILRLVIDEDWEPQTEVLFKRGRAVVKTYNYLTLWVAYQTKQKTYEYTHMTVRRARSGSGDWGDTKYSGTGHQWTREIRKENFYK
jgi:hypothetical protein